MTSRIQKDGYIRIVHDDSVIWYIDNNKEEAEFVVARFPFVPDYHLCDWTEGENEFCERPVQHFTTLTQALAVLRVIEGSSP